jgi:hypothetical protein
MKKYLGFIAAAFLLAEGFNAGAATAGEWGAVATGPNGAYGWAVDFDSEQGAKDYALSACEGACTDGGVSFANSCASIAVGGGYFGWAASISKSTAISASVEQCGGSGVCETKVWGCAGEGTTD